MESNSGCLCIVAATCLLCGVMFLTQGRQGDPVQICTEAKAKGYEMFTCKDVKL